MPPDFTAALPPRLRREFQTWKAIQPIAADGSDRRFFRLHRPGQTRICLFHPQPPGEPVTENDSYDAIGRHLRRQGAPVAEIYVYCREEGWFLLEDLGNTLLQEHYRRLGRPEDRFELYRQALEVLVHLQTAGTRDFSTAWCFDTPRYDADLVRARECHYFLQAFVRGYLGEDLAPESLAEDFDWLLAQALSPGPSVFLHRDFQSRNLMVYRERLWLVDFQGARLGPPQYDLAALLLDPYVDLPQTLQEELVTRYLGLFQAHQPLDSAAWRRRYAYVALCRNLQMLGAYGFLSREKGKTFFQQFIPAAVRNLQHRLDCLPAEELPGLRKTAARAATLVSRRNG